MEIETLVDSYAHNLINYPLKRELYYLAFIIDTGTHILQLLFVNILLVTQFELASHFL